MADYVVKGESLAAVADAIREKTGETDALGLSEMPGKVGDVFEAGKKSEYDAFWDTFQQNGNKNSYDQAFMLPHWTDDTFNPKYPLKMEGNEGGRQCFSANRALTRIPVPIYAKNTRLIYTFQNCTALKTIPLLHIEGVTDFNMCFRFCNALENLTIEGVIEKNIDVSDCLRLTHDSLMSIINALKDYSGSDTTYTVTLGTENLAKLTDGEKMMAVNKGWTLVGWTPPEDFVTCPTCGAVTEPHPELAGVRICPNCGDV